MLSDNSDPSHKTASTHRHNYCIHIVNLIQNLEARSSLTFNNMGMVEAEKEKEIYFINKGAQSLF